MPKPCRMPRVDAAGSAACVLLCALHAPLAARERAFDGSRVSVTGDNDRCP